MLHELLLALTGCPGDIFVLDNERNIVVDPALPFITSAEKSILEELLILGTCYFKVNIVLLTIFFL